MQTLPLKQKVARVLPFLQQAGWVTSPPPCDVSELLTKIVVAAGDRITIAGDILQFTEFFTADDAFEYDDKAYAKRLVMHLIQLNCYVSLRTYYEHPKASRRPTSRNC